MVLKASMTWSFADFQLPKYVQGEFEVQLFLFFKGDPSPLSPAVMVK